MEAKFETLILILLLLFQCFKVWDLDARGYHKSMWRMRMKGSEMLVIGVPNSEYS
jgi:beta-1,2-N-acetylglucosaminyltransferase